jgi:hypothetical protein
VRLSPLGTSATTGLLYQPRMIDDECGAVGGIRIGRGNLSSQRKPAPVPLYRPQIPYDLGSNPGPCSGKPASKRLSYIMAFEKYWWPSTELHGVTSHKTVLIIATALITRNIAFLSFLQWYLLLTHPLRATYATHTLLLNNIQWKPHTHVLTFSPPFICQSFPHISTWPPWFCLFPWPRSGLSWFIIHSFIADVPLSLVSCKVREMAASFTWLAF